MPVQSSESAVGKYLGPPISAALGALVTWARAGSIGAVGPAHIFLCDPGRHLRLSSYPDLPPLCRHSRRGQEAASRAPSV